MWVARDENGALYFHGISKPKKDTGEGMWISDNYNPYPINQDSFPEVQAEKGDLDVWVNSLDIEKIDYDDEILYIVSW